MGTTQSRQKSHQERRQGYTAGPSDGTHLPPGKAAPPPRGKTTPPSQPVVSDVTHNSLTLSWLPPRRSSGSRVFAYTVERSTPSDSKAWTVITKSCQGNSYQVKNLSPSSQYVFRVRAENIHGLSKGSQPSEMVETNMFGVEQQLYVPAPEERVRSVPRHQHSINLHLEGTVTAILNHTDIQVKTNASREVRGDCDSEDGSLRKSDRKVHRSLDTVAQNDDVDGQDRKWKSLQRDSQGRSSLQPDRSRTNCLQRDAQQRTSWQPGRKRSLPILLPGTKTDSLNKLRESQTFPTTLKNRLNDSTDIGRKRAQTWGDRSASDVNSSLSESQELMDGQKDSSKNESTTDEEVKPPKRDSGLEEDAENPWERDDSCSEASDGVTSPCKCDVKVDLYPVTDTPPSPPTWRTRSVQGGVPPGGEGGQLDFRMLRSLLHSDEIIVKSSHSLPEAMGAGRKPSPASTLTTIVDLEEEEDSVRVTTL
ncbi:hypothetical protein ACOMHN_009838 [Nucella lapillus]